MTFISRICLTGTLVCLSLLNYFDGLSQEKSVVSDDSTSFKPYAVFSVGGGGTKFLGDVQDASEKTNVHIIGNRGAVDFNIGAALSRSFVLNANVVYGKLSGNENTFKQNRNFDSQFVLLGLNVEYNFAGAWKDRLPVLNPFITAGAYYSNHFNVATDLYYGANQEYHYWENGIYDRSEDSPNAEDKNPISRDFEYETPLVNGSVHAFTASVGFGLDLHLSRALLLRLMSRYFHSMNDNIDGHSQSGIPNMRDGFFINQASLVLSTAAFGKANRTAEPLYKYLFDFSQLETLENEDRDSDGVPDFKDKCAATPNGIEVDKNGCPLDIDEDGIADYRDVNTSSKKDEIVNTKGDSIDYKLIEDRWVNYQGARIIKWDKDYGNPRFSEEDSYALTFAIKEGDELDEASLLKKYPKLTKKQLSDSLVVFNMGTYEKFENAQQASLRTHQNFSHSVVVVNSSYIDKVASDISGITIPDSIQNRGSYGIAESVAEVKELASSNMTQLMYTISRIEAHLDNDVPESVLVKPYLNGLAPFTWNKEIKEIYIEINKLLQENPVADYAQPLATLNDLNEVDVVSKSIESKKEVIESEKTEASKTELPIKETAPAQEDKLVAEFKLSPNAKLEFMPTTERFIVADANKDGLIHFSEIEQVLSSIVEGNSLMQVDEFNEMTELFTDFTENVDPIDFGGTSAAYVDGKLTIFKPQNAEMKKDGRQLLAKKYSDADFNKDGELTADEVQKLIALFMEGKTDYTSEKIYELIDLYFE